MSVLRPKPTTTSPIVTEAPRIHSPTVEDITVDAKFTPLTSLITFVSGYAWTVDYHSQIITKDSSLVGHDPGLPGQFQQYKVIRNLDLKANNPISWNQDNVSKQITATGNSTMHSMVIPNSGDMFVAEVGDGRRAVFQVYNSRKMSLLQQSVYSFDYSLIFFVDNEPNRFEDLNSKIVQELHYIRDFVRFGQNPLVTTDEFNTIAKLGDLYEEMINYYCSRFFNQQFKTFTVPGQITPMYDPFLTNFISKTTTSLRHPNLRDLIVLNADDDYQLKKPSVFDAIYEQSKISMDLAFRHAGVVSAKSFYYNPIAAGIRFSGIDQVVYPLGTDPAQERNVNSIDYKAPWFMKFARTKTHGGGFDVGTPVDTVEIEGLSVPVIKPFQSEDPDYMDYYVFSEEFYKGIGGQSLLEVCVHNFISDRQNTPGDLYKIVKNFHHWGDLEAFYYIPITLVLINSIIRRM